jgi:hypothetical protein
MVLHSGSPGLTRKHWTRLERLAMDKHSGLLQKFVNYSRNNIYDTGPCSHDQNTSFSLYLINGLIKPECLSLASHSRLV